MPTWLEIIRLEIENMNMNEILEPNTEVGNTERVIGVLKDNDLKKIYTLAMQWDRLAIENIVTARYSGDDDRNSLMIKSNELHKKSELLIEIFWTSLKDVFNLWGAEEVLGIRKGWKVVLFKPVPPPIAAFFNQIFGQ